MNNILKTFKLALVVFIVFTFYVLAGGGGGGGGGGSSSSRGFSGYANFNTGGSYGYTATGPNGLSYGYSSYSHGGFSDRGGDGYWGSSGWGRYYCTPNYVTCYSSSNVCGWVNVGTKDIACGGACSASKPPDPVFTINGEQKRVGDTCYVNDPCDTTKQIRGIVTCAGVCSVKSVNAACLTPDNPDTPQDESESPNNKVTDITDSVETQVVSISIPNDIYPPDAFGDHYVAIYAYPNLVRQGQRANIYLLTVGLDYCTVKGSNGDLFKYMGVNKIKLDYINNSCPGAKNAKSDNGELGDYTCKESEDYKVYPSYVHAGPVVASVTSKLNEETKYTVVECYSIDHKGRVAKYIPSASKGDKVTTKVKIVPKFIEF